MSIPISWHLMKVFKSICCNITIETRLFCKNKISPNDLYILTLKLICMVQLLPNVELGGKFNRKY